MHMDCDLGPIWMTLCGRWKVENSSRLACSKTLGDRCVLACIHMCHKVMYKWHPSDDKGSKVGVVAVNDQFWAALLLTLLKKEFA